MIAPELVMSWSPCKNYTPERLSELLGAGKTPLEIIDQYEDADIAAADILWLLLRPEVLPAKQLHFLACDYAEAVLPVWERSYPVDFRPRGAIETKRRWIAGNASNQELAAAVDAARAAARTAARTAARDAAVAAPWAAARAASRAAARAAARTAARAAAVAAAWAAARAAARDTAWDIAWAAALKQQIAQLRAVIAEEEDKS